MWIGNVRTLCIILYDAVCAYYVYLHPHLPGICCVYFFCVPSAFILCEIGLYRHIISGWWFGTIFIFPYIGNNHPNWLIFFRGVETTNQICYKAYWPAVIGEARRSWSWAHQVLQLNHRSSQIQLVVHPTSYLSGS
jgi:hypothetical protein